MSAGPAPSHPERSAQLGSDLDWLALQIDTLYRHDAVGRITHYNAPRGDQATAPFLFFGRTRVGNLWRVRAGLPDSLTRDLFRFAAAEAVSRDLETRPERVAAMRERIERHAPIAVEWRGPAFRFPDALSDGGEARLLTGRDAPLVEASMPDHAGSVEQRAPVFGVVREGRVVALAFCATLPGRACEVGVDTLPAWRGNGFAGQCVAAWAAEMRRRGVIPLYSTGWENTASRALARKLGLISYAADFHFR